MTESAFRAQWWFLIAIVALFAARAGAQSPPAAAVVQPTETASGYVIVTDEKAEVVVGPSADYAVLEIAEDGDIFPLKGKTGTWYFVQTTEQGQGWIHGESVASYAYPEYLLTYQPPDDWVPPSPNWVPPPGWIPPAGWVKRAAGWLPPPRWRPFWWSKWHARVPRAALAPRRPGPPGPRRLPPRPPPPPPHRPRR